ncbi:MAG: hypothetical protein HQ561_13480 [Desulfobacteraceae bacterium]|nr:hypothetical protein [Desulfobacteraceae bacterium]
MGVALSNTNLILLGAIPAVLLALIVDFSIGSFEWGPRPERKLARKNSDKILRLIALMMPLILIFFALISYFAKPSSDLGHTASSILETGTIRI